MRILLTVLFVLCVPSLGSAAYPNCDTCPSHWCMRTCQWDNSHTHYICFEYCAVGPNTSFYLAPRTTPNPFAAGETVTLDLYSDTYTALGSQYLADILGQALGWGVQVPSSGVGPFKPGTYSGTIADVAEKIAADGNATVKQIDEANHMIIFGTPEK